MERVQAVIRTIEPHDSVERFTSLGVDCVQGSARLVSPWEVEVGGRRISAVITSYSIHYTKLYDTGYGTQGSPANWCCCFCISA